MSEAEFDAIAAAPGRVHLLGEPAGCRDALVLALPLGQRARVAMRRSHGSEFTLHAQDRMKSEPFTREQPPAGPVGACVFACLQLARERAGEIPPLDIEVGSDVPVGVGLGAGAALELATLRCLRQLLDWSLDDLAIAQLAHDARVAEGRGDGGILDAMVASLAATDRPLLLDGRSRQGRALPLPPHSAVLVLDAGGARAPAGAVRRQRRSECAEAARRLGLPSLRAVQRLEQLEALPDLLLRRARHVFTEHRRVLEAAECGAAARFGALLDASHASLRDDYEASTAPADRLVALLQEQPGVYGARLSGPGGAVVALCRADTLQACADDTIAKYFAEGHDGRQLVPVLHRSAGPAA